jgi:outer membrane protein OmpA-like peptidoglycan-associated protein
LNPKATHFLDAKNAPIAFKVMGENVVLTGRHASFTVSTAAAASRVIRKPTAPLPEPVTVTVATATGTKQLSTADSNETIEAEIRRVRKELGELKAMLAAAAAARDAGPAAPIVATAEQARQAEAQVVIVSFANNSRQFSPAQEQKSQLLALSQSAESISIRGFTDSDFPTPGSVALARARAEAAKRYLVSMGVTARKIVVGYDGSGKFIAENRTAAGRAANRRVEIAGS